MDQAPKTAAEFQAFLDEVVRWAKERADIQAVALVGSYARAKATQSSDIDLVLLVDDPEDYLADASWIFQFGPVFKQQVEEYGPLTSLRVWYWDGPEVEFGLTNPGWTAQPLDEGTDRVLMDGVRVLYEQIPLLSPLLEGFLEAEDLYLNIVQAIRQRANPDFAAQNGLWFKNNDFRSYGLRAAEHKEISRMHNRAIQQLPLRGRLHLARWLVLSGIAEEANFANAALARSVKELGLSNFAYLDEHLNHLHGWGQTDDFCINVLQPLLWKHPQQTLALLQNWSQSENLWKRRVSVVTFVRKVGASGKFTQEALQLCETLLWDKEDLVQKGVGWALKDVMRGDPERVLDYIKTLHRRGAPATITLYAIRNLKGAERREILEIRAVKIDRTLAAQNQVPDCRKRVSLIR